MDEDAAMKRAPQLRDLSEDHHHGLVLARKAKIAASGKEGPSEPEMWAEVEAVFKSELAPHFEIEEALIGTALRAAGESQLAQRLTDEHEALRRFIVPGHPHTTDDLRHFGELLEQHIRFEERELFQVAQEKLTSDELGAVAKACHDRVDES
jgi:hemerythrin-like domain-containing protein